MPTQDSSAIVPPETAGVVIVGAGVAGLYCAYRLLKENKATDVVIIERLNRIGGRLDTDLIQVKGADGDEETVRDEEGGMRFNYGMHQLMALNGALDLCDSIVPFPMGPTPRGRGGSPGEGLGPYGAPRKSCSWVMIPASMTSLLEGMGAPSNPVSIRM